MKRTLHFLLIAASLLLISRVGYAQCRDFAQKTAVPLLGDQYVLSGRYHYEELRGGESMETEKIVSRGIDYRIVVLSAADEPVEFQVKDWNSELIYDNSMNNYSSVWDYKCDKSQKLRIVVYQAGIDQQSQTERNCAVILMGIKRTFGQ